MGRPPPRLVRRPVGASLTCGFYSLTGPAIRTSLVWQADYGRSVST